MRVKGKRFAVPVYELLGRRGEVAEEQLAYAREFGHAIELFQKRAWQEALDAFTTCGKQRPEDLAVQGYVEATLAYQQAPPPEEWTGAIELKEK